METKAAVGRARLGPFLLPLLFQFHDGFDFLSSRFLLDTSVGGVGVSGVHSRGEKILTPPVLPVRGGCRHCHLTSPFTARRFHDCTHPSIDPYIHSSIDPLTHPSKGNFHRTKDERTDEEMERGSSRSQRSLTSTDVFLLSSSSICCCCGCGILRTTENTLCGRSLPSKVSISFLLLESDRCRLRCVWDGNKDRR